MKNPWQLVRWGISIARVMPGAHVIPWEIVLAAVNAIEDGRADDAGDAAYRAAELVGVAAGRQAKTESDRLDAASERRHGQASGASAAASSNATEERGRR